MDKPKYVQRECKTHGKTRYAHYGESYRCQKCTTERVAERRRKAKEILVERHGGGCRICGYNKYIGALDFHHVDPSTKKFALSARGLTKGIDTLKKEADKCVLLCANCHREVEAGIIIVDIAM